MDSEEAWNVSATESKWRPWSTVETMNLQTTTVLTAFVAIMAGCLILKHVSAGKKRRLPPGPRGLPLIGHLHLLGGAPHRALASMAEKYGDIIHLRMGVRPTVVISSPELAKEVLKDQDQLMASRPCFESGKILAYGNESISLMPHGDKWRFMRKIVSTELLTANRIRKSQNIRREELQDTLEDMLTGGQKGEIVNIDEKLTAMVLNQTTRFNFHRRYLGSKRTHVADGAEEFQSLVKELSGTSFFLLGEFFPFLMFLDVGGAEKRMRNLASKADRFYSSILASHRNPDGSFISKDPSDMDFLDVLLAHQNDTKAITDKQIKAAIQDIVMASSSTSSSTVTWALAELMRSPDSLKEAQKELDEVVGRERLVQESDIPNLPYIRAVVRETFRLHPVLPLLLPHQSDHEDVKIGGYDITAQTRVMINTYAIGRDPRIWTKPLDFSPDRFMNGNPVDVKGQHYQLLPFGSGRRMCVGYNLGLITVQFSLAQILHTCDFSLPEGTSPKDISMEEHPGAAVTRAHPLHLRVKPRLPAHVYATEGMNV